MDLRKILLVPAIIAMLLLGGATLTPTGAAADEPTAAPLTAKPKPGKKFCSRGRVELIVKGITCKKGKKVIRRAQDKYVELWPDDGVKLNIGKFRCDYPAYLGYIVCKHTANPMKKWVSYASE